MKKSTIALAGAFLFATGSMTAQAADIAAGNAAFTKFTCASCHGADAAKTTSPAYPVLAGQHADYLRHALRAYQRGQKNEPATANIRKNPIMGAMAAQLKPADIDNIAAYLASLPSPLSTQE